MLHKIVKEILDGLKELTGDYLTYYFKDDTAKKRFYDFNNGIELFKKIKSGEASIRSKKSSIIYLNQIWPKYQEEV